MAMLVITRWYPIRTVAVVHLQNGCCGRRGSSGGRFTVVWAENHGSHRDMGTTWGHHGGRCNLPFYWYIDV